jgi:hypothetical protein
MSNICVVCGENGKEYLGYIICNKCLSKLKLLSDEKIKKYLAVNKLKNGRSFEEEIKFRLILIEKDYIKKKIKLLHVMERIREMKKVLYS